MVPIYPCSGDDQFACIMYGICACERRNSTARPIEPTLDGRASDASAFVQGAPVPPGHLPAVATRKQDNVLGRVLLAVIAALPLILARPALALIDHPYETDGAWMAEVWPAGEAPRVLGYWSIEDHCRRVASKAAADGALWRCRRVLMS